jgi:hypothetical protein
MIDRILLYRSGALGDNFLTLPALETSRLEVLAGALAETEAYPGGDT